MKTKLTINRKFTVGEIDSRIYGGFIEQLGRAVYGGLYDPESEFADEDGFRGDVIELIKELDMPITRFPGGNFVSAFNWQDAIGDISKRPVRTDPAWFALDPNLIGTDEFMRWCKKANTEPMMAVNLGTLGPVEAQAQLEYCNFEKGTYWSDLRRKNGTEAPHNIKLWCLGNEMDGQWQTGHKSAEEYGNIARETAKLMKWTDPTIELCVCGSSSPAMSTLGDWEAKVLERTYEHVDYISIHSYYSNSAKNLPEFLASPETMNRYIQDIKACCDFAKCKLKQNKVINLSFDEWNVWFHSHGDDKHVKKWIVGRPILEDIYDMADALVVGGLLITLLNNADRVKIACLAQSVNVIAPIMTEKNGGAWRQTIFYPFALTSKYGRGTVLMQNIESPNYTTSKGEIPYLCSTVIYNEDKKEFAIFALNRNLTDKMELFVDFENYNAGDVIEHIVLQNDDIYAVNSAASEVIKPRNQVGAKTIGNQLVVELQSASWNLIRVKCN